MGIIFAMPLDIVSFSKLILLDIGPHYLIKLMWLILYWKEPLYNWIKFIFLILPKTVLYWPCFYHFMLSKLLGLLLVDQTWLFWIQSCFGITFGTHILFVSTQKLIVTLLEQSNQVWLESNWIWLECHVDRWLTRI